MKFLAIVDIAEGAEIAEIRAGLGDEVRGAWSLFASGILREAYATEKPTRVIFVLEAPGEAETTAHLTGLPLIASGHFAWRLAQPRPFVNSSALFAK